MSQASSPLTLPLVAAQVSSLQTPGPGSSRSPAREPPSSLQTAGGARPPPATREGGPAPLCKVPSERCRFFLDAVATLGPGRNAASDRVPGDRAGDDRAPPRARGFPGEAKGSGSGPSPVRAEAEAGGDRGLGSVAPPVVLGGKDRRGCGQRQVLAFSARRPHRGPARCRALGGLTTGGWVPGDRSEGRPASGMMTLATQRWQPEPASRGL